MMKGTKKERKGSSVVLKVPEHGAVSSYSNTQYIHLCIGVATLCHPSQWIMEPFDFFSSGIV